jgi:glycosyltransferase involved in cell wall biosynthesis
MAAGVAMVVTDVGGNAEAVLDGECGIVVPARNPKALGEAILALVKDEDMRRRMAKSGHQRIVEKFSLDACVQQYAGLYQALLADPHCSVQNALDLASNRVSK